MEWDLTRYYRAIINKKHQQLMYLPTQLSCCLLCKQACQSQPLLCDYCQADLPLFDIDKVANNLLNWPAVNKLFPKRNFDQLICLAPYIWPFDQWLKQLKYQQQFELANLLANLLTKHFKQLTEFDNERTLMCVPVHIKKWQQRGFNQAHLIARAFAEKAKLAYSSDSIKRLTFQHSQVGLTGAQRRNNLAKAFKVNLSNQSEKLPERVILFDDVITTGATVNSICKLLKQQGVKHITILTVAISLPN